jgi:hypothetical protein
MALDVPIPDPPSLHGPQSRGTYDAIDNPVDAPDDDYRRHEVELVLAEGAWADGFEAWAAESSLTAESVAVVVDHELIDEFDFYWDATTDEVGYQSPTLPQATRDALDADTPDDVESELDTLGRIVSEVLENDYLRRDEDTFGFFADEGYESREE